MPDNTFDDLSEMKLSPEHLEQNAKAHAEKVKAPKTSKTKRRSRHFTRIPMTLWEQLSGAPRQTLWMANYVLYLHWKGNGEPFKLSNDYTRACGIPPSSKQRALRDLARRNVISVDWRARKSPLVSVVYREPITMGD
jgi:hypothetical protein